jgi:hypothetical protein
MEVRLRSTRTLKVTEVRPNELEQVHLADLYQDARYESLLNLMERACIELETGHFNTPLNDPEGILGGHILCKSAWLFFTYIQKWVQNSYHSRAATEEVPQVEPTLEDMIQGVEGWRNNGTISETESGN